MLMVHSAAAIFYSSREEGVVDMIVGAERKKNPWWSPLFDIADEPKPSSFMDSSPLSSMSAKAKAETNTIANPNPKVARRSGLGFTAEKADYCERSFCNRELPRHHVPFYHRLPPCFHGRPLIFLCCLFSSAFAPN